jgi:hypothetical protein
MKARSAALLLALAMLAIVIWGLFFEAGSTTIVIDGHQLSGPLKGTIGVAGLIIGLIALFCAAIFLLFVFAGIGILILGGVIVAGLVLAATEFPFLLLVLLPLAVVWVFIAMTRQTRT